MIVAGAGVDIVDVERIEKAREKWGDRFLNKIFTAGELKYSLSMPVPEIHLAARFAAKEACFKALDSVQQKKAGWQQIEVVLDKVGKPHVALGGVLKEYFAEGEVLHLSLAHTRQLAIAMAVRGRESVQ
ncbi:MAG: holo-ACP synthase [Candidatus Omnitrophica bacterium]|nr:holo-ACP synthase [Candidatus Omnitrophota bacterium]